MPNPRRLMLATLLVTLLAGCAETETKSTADKPATAEATDQEAAAEDAATEEPAEPEEPAGVGDSITLSGTDDELEIRVKLLRYRPAVTASEFETPDGKYVGVELLMENTGTMTYSDSPTNGAKMISRTDREFDPTITVGGNCESPGSVKIAPGSKRRMCIPFDVPKSVKAKTFQMALDSGFGPQTGEWTIGGS